jgi:radical SAM superfamily enzyme YgiQ (UPF0313 family)
MHLLLINPKFPESFWSFKWAVDNVLPGKRAVNPPLGLATLAALCPSDWRVEIIDENIESIPLTTNADIVGVCGMGVQLPRQRELLAYYRGQGHYVVAGGSYASLCWDDFAPLADTVIAGEAEYIWKAFCDDFTRGVPLPLYHETGTVSLADSPTPRFDLLKLHLYANVTLQFSRGCPFLCEFCDIIVMFGRKPRTKSLEQVGLELDELRRLGVRQVFFVDDNLIGDPRRAKELLRYLEAYQDRHGHAFSFGTEVSLNLAQDDELLALFRAANFGWVFIGIESPEAGNLKETGKVQNLREDPLSSVRKIYAHGIDILAGFIIGFDNDSLDTFDTQYRFITEAGIQSAMVGLLMALPRTPLYERMEREGRLIETETTGDNTRPTTNIRPKTMSMDAMVNAYQDLYLRLLEAPEIATRIRNKMAHMRDPVYGSGYSMPQRLGIIGRLFVRGILSGGPRRIVSFLGTFPLFSPGKIPLMISEWIIALSMRRFAVGQLSPRAPEDITIARKVASFRAALARPVEQGRISVDLCQEEAATVDISFSGLLDRRTARLSTRHLRRLLKKTGAKLTLRVHAIEPSQVGHWDRMLRRLRRHGDRISIVLDNSLRDFPPIDSSVFHLALPVVTDVPIHLKR